MLEDISNILNNGEVPNLFDKIKIKIPTEGPIVNGFKAEVRRDEIYAKMGEKLKAKGIRGEIDNATLWKMFIDNVKSKLHIMIVQSPSGDDFRFRMRSFPNLINCATINWFHQWPTDALIETATSKFKDLPVDQALKDKLIRICCF